MTPRTGITRSRPVEYEQLTDATLPAVKGWLADRGYAIEIHDEGDHGLVSHDDGLVRVRLGDFITLTDGRNPQTWDATSFREEHPEVAG